ncbi:MAG: cobalamin biosynthesis protein, partial [Hyphomicrobiales bacterium]
MSTPLIMVLGPSGAELGDKIAASIGGEVAARGEDFSSTAEFVQDAFVAGKPVIGLCAAGILIRTLGPLVSDKHSEPPVIAVAEDGSSIVPLLGGHHGANDLAREIAALTGGHAAITTAGDVRFGIALDGPPEGYVLANREHAKPAMAALLAGASAKLSGAAEWLSSSDLPFSADGEVELCITHHAVTGNEKRLVYHPKNLVLGVGSSRGCPADEMIALVEDVLKANKLSRHAIACIASIDVKADEAAMHALAVHLNVPVRFFSAEILNQQAARLANPSDVVLAEVGCPGVAEGAALSGAGASSTLMVEKTKTAHATCAIALAREPVNAFGVGRARGWVSVVGIGPGQEEWRSGEASHLLRVASDWVGYGLYLDIVAELSVGRTQHRFDLGEEETRVRHALELAGEGRDVALVCSGDAGIYAMAA